ncbi:MAG: hypothetical protein WAN10_19210 [Candidatus Acidiferrales bacterium]
MKPKGIGTVFAERELDGESNGSPCKVVVRLGKPFQNEDESWCCPYSVTSPAGERVFYGAGFDSLQALRAAMANVGAELKTVYAELKLKWANGDDLGF